MAWRRRIKASGAETAATIGSTFTNPYPGRSGYLHGNVSAASGTNRRLGVFVEGRDTTAGNWHPLVTGAGTRVYSPTLTTTAAGANLSTYGGFNIMLDSIPAQVRIRSSLGGTTPSFTYSVDLVVAG